MLSPFGFLVCSTVHRCHAPPMHDAMHGPVGPSSQTQNPAQLNLGSYNYMILLLNFALFTCNEVNHSCSSTLKFTFEPETFSCVRGTKCFLSSSMWMSIGHFLHFFMPGIILFGGNLLSIWSFALHKSALRLLGFLKATIRGIRKHF